MTSYKKLICAVLLVFLTLETFAADLTKSDYDALERTIEQYAPELLSRPSVKKLLNPLEWKRVEKISVNNPMVDKMKKLLDLTTFYSYDASVAKDNAGLASIFGSGIYYLVDNTTAQELFLNQFIAFECPDEYNAAIAKKEAQKIQEKKAQEERELAKKKKIKKEQEEAAARESRKSVSNKNKSARDDCDNYYLYSNVLKQVRRTLKKEQKFLLKGEPCAFKDGDFLDKFTAFIDTLTADKVIELSYQKDFVCPYIYDGIKTGLDITVVYASSNYDAGEKYSWFYGDNYNTDWLKSILGHFGTPLVSNFINALDWNKLVKLDDDLLYTYNSQALVSFTPMTFYLFYYYLDLLKQQGGAAQ